MKTIYVFLLMCVVATAGDTITVFVETADGVGVDPVSVPNDIDKYTVEAPAGQLAFCVKASLAGPGVPSRQRCFFCWQLNNITFKTDKPVKVSFEKDGTFCRARLVAIDDATQLSIWEPMPEENGSKDKFAFASLSEEISQIVVEKTHIGITHASVVRLVKLANEAERLAEVKRKAK